MVMKKIQINCTNYLDSGIKYFKISFLKNLGKMVNNRILIITHICKYLPMYKYNSSGTRIICHIFVRFEINSNFIVLFIVVT